MDQSASYHANHRCQLVQRRDILLWALLLTMPAPSVFTFPCPHTYLPTPCEATCSPRLSFTHQETAWPWRCGRGHMNIQLISGRGLFLKHHKKVEDCSVSRWSKLLLGGLLSTLSQVLLFILLFLIQHQDAVDVPITYHPGFRQPHGCTSMG